MESYSRIYKKTEYTITKNPRDKITPWECSNGHSYSSLSAATRDISGNAHGGPEFWVGTESHAKLKAAAAKRAKARSAKMARPAKAAPAAKPKSQIKPAKKVGKKAGKKVVAA